MEVFNIHLEFDHESIRKMIEKCIKERDKGYVCVVDGNVLTMAQKDEMYRQIVNKARFNTCDGSSIAAMCNHIYGTRFTTFSGPQLFSELIVNCNYRQLLVGNTQDRFIRIKDRLEIEGKTSDHLFYLPLPFMSVEEFNYAEIGKKINQLEPDLIWISLGAPKQETFCSNLLPFLESGLMFGIGAALNFYVGDIAPSRFIWFKRIFQEPKKQVKRCWNYLTTMPKIYCEEVKRSRNT